MAADTGASRRDLCRQTSTGRKAGDSKELPKSRRRRLSSGSSQEHMHFKRKQTEFRSESARGRKTAVVSCRRHIYTSADTTVRKSGRTMLRYGVRDRAGPKVHFVGAAPARQRDSRFVRWLIQTAERFASSPPGRVTCCACVMMTGTGTGISHCQFC